MARILIVEDAEETRSVLAMALRTISGAAVTAVENAEQALRMLADAPIDVLVTDVNLGGMTGLELLAVLRQRGRWPLFGVVVISGEEDSELPRKASEAGADAFVAKPFSAVEIRRRVLSLMESHHDSA